MENFVYLPEIGVDYSEFFSRFLDVPHLLISGATGSGKSVFVNGLIYTAMRERFPFSKLENGCAFVFLDAKGIEFQIWENTLYNIFYGSDPEDIISGLEGAYALCKRRFDETKTENEKAMRESHTVSKTYSGGDIYIVIDEWADLITNKAVKSKAINLVQRIAQIGRAQKVHIWLCTQTPIAKVLPTEIKCNFDYVIGLHTTNKNESRLIIGENGLETLPPYGDCIFKSAKGMEHLSIPYVSEEEQIDIALYWQEEIRKISQK